MPKKIRIIITSCSNPFFWYREEAKKKGKKRNIYEAINSEVDYGLVIPHLGFVFKSDIKILSPNKA